VVNTPGTYWVQIATACDTITDSIHVRAILPPRANFTSQDSFLTVTFNDGSSGPTNWFWNFGDGNTSTSQHPQHTYADFGTYIVCLQVWNECGADTICDTLNIRTIPIDDVLQLGLNWEVDYAGKQILMLNKNHAVCRFSLLNLNGQIIQTGKIANQQQTEVPFGHLPKGMYLLRFELENQQTTVKWVNY
jgi:PKD repeat protein